MTEQQTIEYAEDDPQRPFISESDEMDADGPEEASVVPSSSEPENMPVAKPDSAPDLNRSEVEAFRALWGVASQISKTEFVPAKLRGKTDQVFATMIQGRALGVDAMTSLREIWISPQGSPELSAELQAGLVRKAGHRVSGESSTTGATLTGIRGDTSEEMTITFTLEDAESQGLVKIKDGKPHARSKNGQPLPWERYPAQMLWHRAMTTLTRRLFPDVLIGDIE